jgi:predicted DNA-binding transcriptional regulator AlpA
MHTVDSRPRYLSPQQAAEFLSLSVSTLAKWRVKGGGPPYVKLGRRVAYAAAVLDQWAALHQRRNTCDTVQARP